MADNFASVKEISSNTDYWFVRTDDGRYFETFLNNGFIGIGWNYITLQDLNSKNENLKLKIIKNEGFDISDKKTKSKVTTILNKLENFLSLKKGDVIVIPSHGSARLAFGIVEDSLTYIENENKIDCSFIKRKKIRWVAVKNFLQLDPNFYKIKISRHTISKIDKKNIVYVDNVINTLYVKNNNTHYVIDIKKENDINVDPLIDLIKNIQYLIERININFQYNDNIEENSIRLNLQSPGSIEFKLPGGKSLATLAAILSLINCNNVDQINTSDNNINNFVKVESDTLKEIKKSFEILKVDKDKINSFEYGH